MAAVKRRRSKPGSLWRFLAHRPNGGIVEMESEASVRASRRLRVRLHLDEITPIEAIFDEIVVDHWLHVEQMTRNGWWMRLGDASLFITVGNDGRATKITMTEPTDGPRAPFLNPTKTETAVNRGRRG
jgi:hypothetical protein